MLGRYRWIIIVAIFLAIALFVRLQPDQRRQVEPSPETPDATQTLGEATGGDDAEKGAPSPLD